MHEPKIVLQPRKRIRYLKIIALFKIFKGALLFLLGFSLRFGSIKFRIGQTTNCCCTTAST